MKKSFDELFALVQPICKHGQPVAEETMSPRGIRVDAADIRTLCLELRDNKETFFDMLSCLTVIDNGPAVGTIEVIYNLYSIPYDHHLALKVIIGRDQAEVDSVQDIWKTADWHEREAWDLFGVKFNGHPDLRRILLPADWEGHPLRKDYQQQQYYRGVRVEF